jgi:hypothetical protein
MWLAGTAEALKLVVLAWQLEHSPVVGWFASVML